jgi:hypothetical protein
MNNNLSALKQTKKSQMKKFLNQPQNTQKRNQAETATTTIDREIQKAQRQSADDDMMTEENKHSTSQFMFQNDSDSLDASSISDNEKEILMEVEKNNKNCDGNINVNSSINARFNPNEDENYSMAIRQQTASYRVRSHLDEPIVKWPEKYIGYYDLKVKLRPSTDPWKEVANAFMELLNLAWSIDSTIKIFIYSSKERAENDDFIGKPDDMKDLANKDLLKFFERGYPLPEGGFRSAKVVMTHDQLLSEIMTCIGSTLKRSERGIYKCAMQAEKFTTIGWAYMSTQYTHKDSLAQALKETLGIPIALQWRLITTDVPPAKIPKKQLARALHFIVEDGDVEYAKQELSEMYNGVKYNDFPLGMRLRFMPMFARVPNIKAQGRFRVMMGYQQRFCRHVGEITNGDILDIDGSLPSGQTLREYLMEMRIDGDEKKPLFVAINPSWNDKGYIYNFMPQSRDVAKLTLEHLLVKLRHENIPYYSSTMGWHRIDRLFAPVAQERADETKWDAENNCAIAIGVDSIDNVFKAMEGVDEFLTFHEGDDDTEMEKTTNDDNSTKVDELSYGDSIVTMETTKRRRTRSNDRGSRSSYAGGSYGSRSVSFAPGIFSPNSTSGDNTVISGFSQTEFDDAVGRAVERHMTGNITQMQGLMSNFQQEMRSTLTDMKKLHHDAHAAHHQGADEQQQL